VKDEEDEVVEPLVTIEVRGLSLYTNHGVGAAEREVGQRLVFDVTFDVDDCTATMTDDVDDTIDYADVCQFVALTASERSFKTLEALCSSIADRLIERYGATTVSVRAAKPEPPIPLPVEEVAVEVFKQA
jgi:7,8-dihydroneopterin aldolase/epimerase/oxygenase